MVAAGYYMDLAVGWRLEASEQSMVDVVRQLAFEIN
jgi:hypothetical protein